MSGFFEITYSSQKPKIPKGAIGCDACGLFRNVRSPKMSVSGNGRLKAFLLGEGPGKTEDDLNKQFVGDSGNKLKFHLKTNGYDLDEDFWRQNAVCCRPTNEKGSNRTPTSSELKYCEPRWRAQINELKPEFIYLFGAKAVEAFFMYRSQPITKNLSINRWRKLCIPDSQTGAWILPNYHPSFVVRNPDVEPIFKLDLKWSLEQLNRKPPTFSDYRQKIACLTAYDDVLSMLNGVYLGRFPIVFDYETSGLKPYRSGHKIYSISLRKYGEDQAFAFPYQYPGVWSSEQLEQIRLIWSKILSDPDILKIAQNIQMEHPWSKYIIGVEPQGWYWDTMVFSHIEDERPEFTSLDFQTFRYFGYEYGDKVHKFGKAEEGSPFNRMDKCPLPDLLEYNGLDSYFTMGVAEKQWQFVESDIQEAKSCSKAYELFHEGILTFSDMEQTGIQINTPYYQDTSIHLGKRQDFIIKQIQQTPEAAIFRSKTGKEIISKKPTGDIALSNDDLKLLLYKFLEYTPTKMTVKDNISIDDSVLKGINTPFTQGIEKIRGIAKLKTTYIDGMLDLQVDGRIHPNFNLHLVRTYRSSSSDPNFQNLPRRDKWAMALVRGGIIPSPGNCIIEADYGGHEIRIVTCYSKDPEMKKELLDEHDIHGDWGVQLGVKRFDSKNAFVFAEIYGSYYKNVWEDLYNRGYHNVSLMHVQKVERDFWNRYKATKKFQETLIQSYRSNGYVEMYHGFRRRGFLGRNEIINTPIQGTAFHCLLWSCNRLNQIRKKEGWLSKIIGQIHDSILFDAHPSEIPYLIPLIKRVMTQDILPDHPWIIVPLLSEVEVTEIDKPWHTKSEYDKDN